MATEDDVREAILALVTERAPRSICPSEAARRCVGAPGDWRALMPLVRAVAARLMAEGTVRVTQRGQPVDPLAVRGPIRLSAASADDAEGSV